MSQTSTEGSGKKNFFWFFLLGLKYTLRTCFEFKNFAEILSWAEQSGTQVFSLSNLVLVSDSCAAIPFQLFDIWWSSLDIINYFKAISSIGFFCFGEINRSLFWIFQKKKILPFLFIWKCNNQPKKLKKLFFEETQNNDLVISPKRKNPILEMALKSFIMSKLDHQMSKSWKGIAAHELETTNKFDKLKNWVPDCSAQDRILKKTSLKTKKCSSKMG